MKKLVLLFILSFVGNLIGKDGIEIKQTFSKNKLSSTQAVIIYNQEKFQLIQDAKNQSEEEDKKEINKKSGIKAALFSAVVPGAGEYYAESYWKSAIFAAIEIAAWAGYLTYEDKGDSKDIQMRKLGDARWSEQRYWTKVYFLSVAE